MDITLYNSDVEEGGEGKKEGKSSSIQFYDQMTIRILIMMPLSIIIIIMPLSIIIIMMPLSIIIIMMPLSIMIIITPLSVIIIMMPLQ